MSKAFTRESDDLPDDSIVPRAPSSLLPGTINYLTSSGARTMREELSRLLEERAQVTEATKQRQSRPVRLLEQRIVDIQQSLATAEIVSPPEEDRDRVSFGATVSVRERGGEESSYRIVGVDEIDVDRGWVSWLSPIARAMINARVGDKVTFRFPSGEKILEIVGIAYE